MRYDGWVMQKSNIIILTIIIMIPIMLGYGCDGGGSAKIEPYEYTHTTELKQVEIYENERIRDAQRSEVFTLEQSGYGDLTITGGEEAETVTVKYTLPDDASQGPDTWYIINLHFFVEFEEDTGGGFCDIGTDVGARVQFETLRVNDSPYVHISGESIGFASIRMDVRYYNYMMDRSVKPGVNEMNFKIKEYQGTRIKSVTFFNDTAIETTTTSPTPPEQESFPKPETREPFYGVSPELTEELEQICLADPRIRELVKDREYSFIINGNTVAGQDYHLAVGVRLKEDIDSEQFKEWIDGDRHDSDLIREYVGLLNIGYSETYDIVIDFENKTVAELTKREKMDSRIPELTNEERERAVTVALTDATLQKILEGKEYQVAPEGIGVWHDGEIKLGAAFEIHFDKTYEIDSDLPQYGRDAYHYTGEANRLMVGVLLEDNRVVNIIPLNFPPLE